MFSSPRSATRRYTPSSRDSHQPFPLTRDASATRPNSPFPARRTLETSVWPAVSLEEPGTRLTRGWRGRRSRSFALGLDGDGQTFREGHTCNGTGQPGLAFSPSRMPGYEEPTRGAQEGPEPTAVRRGDPAARPRYHIASLFPFPGLDGLKFLLTTAQAGSARGFGRARDGEDAATSVFPQAPRRLRAQTPDKEGPNATSARPELQSFRYRKARRPPNSSAQPPLHATLQDKKKQGFTDYYPRREGSQLPPPHPPPPAAVRPENNCTLDTYFYFASPHPSPARQASAAAAPAGGRAPRAACPRGRPARCPAGSRGIREKPVSLESPGR